jgi:hypothetical protein
VKKDMFCNPEVGFARVGSYQRGMEIPLSEMVRI